MIPGEPLIRHCPSCNGLIRQSTLTSGNTFGGRFWTDGKVVAPMLPHYPLLVRCSHCRHLLWINDAPEVAKQVAEEHAAAQRVQSIKDPLPPVEEDYLEALRTGMANSPNKERYMRVHAWQIANDAARLYHKTEDGTEMETAPGESAHPTQAEMQTHFSAEAIANLKALALLLDGDNQNDRIMKAEIARELGRFTEAAQLLDFSFDEDYETVANLIKDLAAAGKRQVVEIIYD